MKLPHQQMETPKAPETPQRHTGGSKARVTWSRAGCPLGPETPPIGFTVGLPAQPCPAATGTRSLGAPDPRSHPQSPIASASGAEGLTGWSVAQEGARAGCIIG